MAVRPTHDDELAMMLYATTHDRQGIPMWTFFVEKNGMNDKRYHYVLDKWERRGWWEFGVSLRAGWLTDAGRVAMTTKTGADT